MWLHKWGSLNILLCARILKNQNVYILGTWASWCIITIITSVFANRHSFLYGSNESLVRYCFLWLLYGRGERFVQYCFLWRSCADAGCHVYVPWVYHLAAKQSCTDVRVWLPKLGGLNIFCAHVLRGYLWASPIFLLFFFVDVGNRTNVTSLIGFFCTRTYTREIWRASRA